MATDTASLVAALGQQIAGTSAAGQAAIRAVGSPAPVSPPVLGQAPTTSAAPVRPYTGNAGGAVGIAAKMIGTPYQWGGNGPGGIDCSGLVQQTFRQLGINLPRTTYQQVNSGTAVGSLAEARPGDLIFLHPGAGGPGHVGIYAGNGQMIDANHTGGSVGVRPIAGYGGIAAIRRVM